MEIRKMLVPESRYSVLCPYPMTPTEITFHNTYNDASALNERHNVANNSAGTSFHIAVDDKEAIQLIPFNRNAWHAGDGNGQGNRYSIGVEICYSKSGGERYQQAVWNAILVIRQLMDMFNIPISKVKTHQERNGKYCPHRMINEGRVKWFKQQLVSGETIDISETPEIPQPSIASGTGIVYITGNNVNLRKGPGTQYDSIRKLNAPENYKVWGRSGGWLNLGGDQWVYKNAEWLRFVLNGQPSNTSVAGKRVESKVNGLNFRNRPSWRGADVVGTVDAGDGFVIDEKVLVDGSPQYKVHNSKEKTFYITASQAYVTVK
ncbi:N-acetylmuramoyl-L-alanine amidase [Bacillus thuringiensis]|nr:N-acetylmuramoyl-L-alanine amidase [Bacillus thuringiensis]MED2758716.1 N-acetylmuramoyl-L-alanine amidase [Bacillus thuringiensis]MED2777943.1 N-acetylmuramoyl-L-alanine amidase [Bacillus thuringiensis]